MLNLPKPRDRGAPQVCIFHKRELEIKNGLVMQCPVEECEIIAVRNDLKGIPMWFVSCNKCNYSYPSPDPEKCIICDPEVRASLESTIDAVRSKKPKA